MVSDPFSHETRGSTTKPRGRVPSKASHSRSYPRGVGLDFKKLSSQALMSYIDHHGVNLRHDAPPSEIAVAVARHFEAMDVDEEAAIHGFLARLSAGREIGPLIPPPSLLVGNTGTSLECERYAAASTDYARSTAYFDGTAPGPLVRRRRRSFHAAKPKEQVAAKITRSDENGCWILASVQNFYPDTETYDVQDDDDTSKLIRLPWTHVMRLSKGTEACFTKNTKVMAIFPETTSFYRAVVSKDPVWKLPKNSTTPIVKELILKFDDDEDAQGGTPHRRVPARYVIPLPEAYFHEDDDDVDLVPLNYGNA